MAKLPDATAVRAPDHAVEPWIVKRWSPRAMSGQPLPHDQLLRLFEAARWAPSTYNEQEWRFLYAPRDTPNWSTFFGLLVEGNQAWCGNASVLIVVLSHKVFAKNGKPNSVHEFDAGAASQNLALQGAAMGLVVHGMAGFDADRARSELQIPEDYGVHAMFAIGYPGDPAALPEKLRAMEEPSGRKPVQELIREGVFAF